MSIFGFIPTGETETSTTFFSDEDASNSATLRAEFTAKVDVIPVPAALPLLLAGMGALGFAARRRKG
jgi:hypothetical protein